MLDRATSIEHRKWPVEHNIPRAEDPPTNGLIQDASKCRNARKKLKSSQVKISVGEVVNHSLSGEDAVWLQSNYRHRRMATVKL